MADGYIQVPPDSTGKKLDTTELAVGANTVERERLQIAGAGATELADVRVSLPSSADLGLVVRTAMGTTATVLGSLALMPGASSAALGSILISTGFNTASIDPRQVTVVAGSSGTGIGTILSTAFGSAAIDPRLVTLQAGTTALVGAVQATIVAATSGAVLWTVGAGSSGVTGTSLISTGLTGAAIDPRLITSIGTTINALIQGTGSSAVLGTVLSATGLTGAAIDPRQATIVGGTSGAGVGTIVSTAAGAAAIDPRQATIVGGTSGAGVGTIVSTAAGAAAIDPRFSQLQVRSTGNTWTDVGYVAASNLVIPVGITTAANSTTIIDPRAASLTASSSQNFPVQISTALNSSYVDPRISQIQVQTTDGTWTSVGYATPLVIPIGITTAHNSTTIIDPRAASLTASSSQVFPIQISTGVNTAYIDPRIVTPSSQWTITAALAAASTLSAAPTSQWTVSIAGTASSAVLGTVLISTGLTGAAVDPRQVTIVGGTSGAYISILNATAQGGATIDPRQSTIVGGTSGLGLGTIVSTGAGAAAIDPRQSTIVAATSGVLLRMYGEVSTGSTAGVNPVGIGGRVSTANPTTAADGARAFLMTDAVGRLVTVASHVRAMVISTGVTITTTSETSILAAAGSSVYHDLTFLSITNRSTANVVRVVLSASSGSGSSGYNFTLAERGGIVMMYDPPLAQQTANSAWCLTVVSGASTVDVSLQAVKNVPS